MLPLISRIARLPFLRLTKPIHRVDHTLKYGQESIDDPILRGLNHVKLKMRPRETYGEPLRVFVSL